MQVPMTPRLRRAPGVVTQPIEDGVVLLNLQTSRCWQLNRLGVEIWTMLERDSGIEDICDQLSTRYSVSRDLLDQDVRDLVEHLRREKLVVESPAPQGSPNQR
jgi:hypothetical protein